MSSSVNHRPKVAVVTRTKDRPLFLVRAIESVARQTYRDYLHIIVNDGGGRSEVEGLVQGIDENVRSKIRVFHRDSSSNAPDSILNESIDRQDSDFIAIHDDDDTWHRDFLKMTVEHLEEKAELAAVVVRADKVIEEIKGREIVFKKSSPWMPDMKVISLYRQCIDNQMTPVTTLIRRSAYESVGGFDDSLPVVGDWEFGLRLLMGYEVDFLDPGYSLAYYHHRPHRKGRSDNTSFAGNEKHRYYTNLVMNRNLRQELAKGSLGIGYIMSKLKYDQHEKAEIVRRLLPHFVTKRLQRRVQG